MLEVELLLSTIRDPLACALEVAAIDYEETVVWQPDPQHKYVALRVRRRNGFLPPLRTGGTGAR
ncbi:unnamed protein product, partial [Ixodes pacificus]